MTAIIGLRQRCIGGSSHGSESQSLRIRQEIPPILLESGTDRAGMPYVNACGGTNGLRSVYFRLGRLESNGRAAA